jgi:ornithine carbamoyltransferase
VDVSLAMRHFVNLLDVTSEEILHLLAETGRLKAANQMGERSLSLQGRVLGLIFDKPSLRTRLSFQAAIGQCGGSSLFLTSAEVGLGSRETLADGTRVMTQYLDAVVLRTFSQSTVEAFAQYSACPVINGLSDAYHPCQALADLFTIQEVFGELQGLTLSFVGDGNNVARSLALACAKVGISFRLACPDGYGFDRSFLETYREHVSHVAPAQSRDPRKAVAAADIIYTDVWTSMGQESEREERCRRFASYQVNDALLESAPQHVRVMHCLPARRGEEVTGSVVDGERSIIFQQASNRLHAQKALLEWLLDPETLRSEAPPSVLLPR